MQKQLVNINTNVVIIANINLMISVETRDSNIDNAYGTINYDHATSMLKVTIATLPLEHQ